MDYFISEAQLLLTDIEKVSMKYVTASDLMIQVISQEYLKENRPYS